MIVNEWRGDVLDASEGFPKDGRLPAIALMDIHLNDLIMMQASVLRRQGRALRRKDDNKHWLFSLEWDSVYLLKSSVL